MSNVGHLPQLTIAMCRIDQKECVWCSLGTNNTITGFDPRNECWRITGFLNIIPPTEAKQDNGDKDYTRSQELLMICRLRKFRNLRKHGRTACRMTYAGSGRGSVTVLTLQARVWVVDDDMTAIFSSRTSDDLLPWLDKMDNPIVLFYLLCNCAITHYAEQRIYMSSPECLTIAWLLFSVIQVSPLIII